MYSNSSKRKSNEYLTLSLPLFGITLVVAILLSLVNFITVDKIASNKLEKIDNAMISVLPEAKQFEDITATVLDQWDGETKILNVQLAKSANGETIGYCVEVAPKGYSDVIDMMVGVSAEGEITDTSIIALSDTPGFGTHKEEKAFKDQFVGKDGIVVPVNGMAYGHREVALISGATYSSVGFVEGVNSALQVYKIIVEEGA